jgi:hypothetical protein
MRDIDPWPWGRHSDRRKSQDATVSGRTFDEQRLDRVGGAQSEEAAMNSRGPGIDFRWLGVSRPMTSSYVEVATFGVV